MNDPQTELRNPSDVDFFAHEPNKAERIEMRKTSKRPSEWLRLLCRDWAIDNPDILTTCDTKFLSYKPYLKGRLAFGETKDSAKKPIDFWNILGIDDEFDKSYIEAQIEKFSTIYCLRGPIPDDPKTTTVTASTIPIEKPLQLAAAPQPTATLAIQPTIVDATLAPTLAHPNLHPVTLAPFHHISSPIDHNAAAAAAVAAAAVAVDANASRVVQKQQAEVCKAHRKAKDAEKALEVVMRQSKRREQKRIAEEKRERKAGEKQLVSVKKAAEKAAREATREERRRKKVEVRNQREKHAQEQKEAALKRAAELVQSNRVPIEITRGAAAATAAAAAAL